MARPKKSEQPDITAFVAETFESPVDIKRHDVPERHAFGEAFLAPADADVSPTGPAPQSGSAGKSEKFSRADHVHAFEGGGGSGGVTAHNQLTGLAVGDDHPQYTLTAEAQAIADASVNTHAAAADPHAQYLTAAEGDALFLTPAEGNAAYAGSAHNHDHGNLTGLADDDHPQYHNNARGDARYEAAGSVATHAAASDPHPTYLTAAEGDALFLTPAEGNAAYAGSAHNHDAAYLSPTEVLAGPNVTVDTTTTPGSVIIGATPGGGGGVTDHGLLTGLADDDHPQYLNQTRADPLYVNVGGDTMSGVLQMGGSQVKNVGAPSQTTDAANKGYVDNLVDAVPWKKPCRIATTVNLAALSGLTAIDGVTPAGNDRILVKNQTTATQNGIYLAASGAWTRASDADGSGELNGAVVLVQEGTTQADTAWMVTTNGNILPASTAMTWAPLGVTAHSQLTGLGADDHPQYLQPAEVLAGTGITVTPSGGNITVASRIQQSGYGRTGDISSPTSPCANTVNFGVPLVRDGIVTAVVGAEGGFATANMSSVSWDMYTNQRTTGHGGARTVWAYAPFSTAINAGQWGQLGMATISWFLPAGNTPQLIGRLFWAGGGAGAYFQLDVTWWVMDVY